MCPRQKKGGSREKDKKQAGKGGLERKKKRKGIRDE